jgi:hypothetical protein
MVFQNKIYIEYSLAKYCSLQANSDIGVLNSSNIFQLEYH